MGTQATGTQRGVCPRYCVRGRESTKAPIHRGREPTSRRVVDYEPSRTLLEAFLRGLKGGTVKQVCPVTKEVTYEPNEERMTRPRSAEQKSAREEIFTAQSWEALREYGNPVYDIA